VLRAAKLTKFMRRLSGTLGALTSWNLQGLFRPVMELLRIIRTLLQRTPTVCGLIFVCDREAMTHTLVEKPQEKNRDNCHMTHVEG